MTRVYHPFHVWEDWKAGMWRRVPRKEEADFLARAIEFTGDAELYGCWMKRVSTQWPASCEHNLTDLSQNRRAWIGHAACQLAINCPEYITRQAWGYLSKEQQDAANAVADLAIESWERVANNIGGQLEKSLFD